MRRQERLRKQVRHQSVHDSSVIEHLAKNFGGGHPARPMPRVDSNDGLCEQIRKEWSGGLPRF
jgi:hypothetical protein